MKVKTPTFPDVVALSLPVFADDFDRDDKNADGIIWADEPGEKNARKMDANGDAVITREGFDVYRSEHKRRKKTN